MIFQINAVLFKFIFNRESSNKLYHGFKKNEVSQLFLSLKIMKINAFWAANQYIWMISEGSRDTEDWNNDAENSALLSQGYITF